jgi:arginine decarboxylase
LRSVLRGIAHLNLVRVSSIFPAGCKIISRRAGLAKLTPGEITFCVMAETRTNEPNRLATAGIGLAVPADESRFGYIAEHHGYGMTEKKTADFVEDMAASMLASTIGVEFDPDTDYDERRDIFRMSGEIVKTRAVVQTAEGNKSGALDHGPRRGCDAVPRPRLIHSRIKSGAGGSVHQTGNFTRRMGTAHQTGKSTRGAGSAHHLARGVAILRSPQHEPRDP